MAHRENQFAKLAVAGILVTALVGCGPKATPDPVACKTAMEQQLANAVHGDQTEAVKPKACDGLTNKQLQDIATQILGEEIGEPSPS